LPPGRSNSTHNWYRKFRSKIKNDYETPKELNLDTKKAPLTVKKHRSSWK